MKLAFSTNAFRKYSVEESIAAISSAGYAGVELMCDVPHVFPPLSKKKIKTIKVELKKNSLVISNLNGFMMCAVKDFHH
ncbi:MAG: sugar phosphate isomerase/epimerase, partial [Thermoproteota archaeon]